MARNKGKRKGSGRLQIPLAVVAGFLPGMASVWAHRTGGFEEMSAEASRIYLGYAGTNRFGYNDTIGFHPYLLRYGTMPVVAGFLVHWLVGGKLGVNRALGRARIPFVRI